MRCTWCSEHIFNSPVLIDEKPYHKTCEQEYQTFLDRYTARHEALERRGKFRVIQGGKSGNWAQK